MEKPALLKELALLLALATVWGAAYSFIRIGVETIPPITLIAARTLLAGGLLLAILRIRGMKLPRDSATWRRFLIQSCLNSALPFTLIAWAELHVEAGLAVILNALTPIFTFLITVAFTRHEPVGLRKLLGVLLGISGTCLIVGVNAFHSAGTDLIAQCAVILASACYAMAAIFGRNFKGLDPMMPAAGSLLCGAAMLIPLSLIVDKPWTLAVSASSLAALLALAVFSTALAFVIYFRLVHTLGSVATTSQAYLRVPIGVGIGAIFLGERYSPTVLSGLVLVVAGVAVMTLPSSAFLSRTFSRHRQAKPEPQKP
ncbi:DMT family transporter [Agrobacterium vitis]|uniref:EamA family transporter n=1 Tax=Agrobacterium vitis TaxID=373 RepID=A0A7K1RHM1_AGRVI|nr:EamA family transporter [Agrobacterium vitis]MVA57503.1 EamA family transporter [Agrobacterium vitis]